MIQFNLFKTMHFYFLLLVSAILLSGCSPMLIQSNPNAYPLEPHEITKYDKTPSVTIENAYKQTEKVTLSTFGRGLEGDLMQYTQTTVDILGRELGNQSIKVGADGEKAVTLKVKNVVYEVGFAVLHTTLNLEAQLGNGETVVVEGDQRSPANAWRSVNGALKRAVVQLMKDPVFAEYINN